MGKTRTKRGTRNIGTAPRRRLAGRRDGRLVVRLDRRRRVDLDALESSATHQNMWTWVRARLSDVDPYVPLDRDGLEQPWQLFTDLWFRAAPSGNVRTCLGTACCDLLREAWESVPEEWHADLLRLVATISPASCRRFLESIAATSEFDSGIVEANLDIHWLEAAASYQPATLPQTNMWKNRLTSDRYRVLSFNALATNLELGIASLPCYYTALQQVTHRGLLLEEAVRVLLNHGADLCRVRLRAFRSEFESTPGLCDAVDTALDAQGQPLAFSVPEGAVQAAQTATQVEARDYLTDMALETAA